MSARPVLRAARADDAAALAALFGQLGYPAAPHDVGRGLAERGGDAARAVVAEIDGRVAGVIVVHRIAPLHVAGCWATVSALVVDEAARGTGIGAALLAEAERFAREQGCSQVELASSDARTRAHAFYARQGFEQRGKRFVKAVSP